MWSAVAKGFIPQAEGEQLQEGLLRGFKLGVDPHLMAGHRWFQNYPSATTTGRTSVAAAVAKRVDAGKTLALGPMTDGLAHALRSTFTASCIFPLGAAAKALLPGQTPDQLEWRPTSDHTRTGLNAATDMTGLRFALTALEEISWFFSTDHFMRVSDVAGAGHLPPVLRALRLSGGPRLTSAVSPLSREGSRGGLEKLPTDHE